MHIEVFKWKGAALYWLVTSAIEFLLLPISEFEGSETHGTKPFPLLPLSKCHHLGVGRWAGFSSFHAHRHKVNTLIPTILSLHNL